LLIFGITSGIKLIENAKRQSIVVEINKMKVAYYSSYDKYGDANNDGFISFEESHIFFQLLNGGTNK
jgi:hypothetical protein